MFKAQPKGEGFPILSASRIPSLLFADRVQFASSSGNCFWEDKNDSFDEDEPYTLAFFFAFCSRVHVKWIGSLTVTNICSNADTVLLCLLKKSEKKAKVWSDCIIFTC